MRILRLKKYNLMRYESETRVSLFQPLMLDGLASLIVYGSDSDVVLASIKLMNSHKGHT